MPSHLIQGLHRKVEGHELDDGPQARLGSAHGNACVVSARVVSPSDWPRGTGGETTCGLSCPDPNRALPLRQRERGEERRGEERRGEERRGEERAEERRGEERAEERAEERRGEERSHNYFHPGAHQ